MRLPLVASMEAMVIGGGASGIAAARLLRLQGFPVRLLEKNKSAISRENLALLEELGVVILYGDFLPYYVEQTDIFVVSPGIPIARIADTVYATKKEKKTYILGEIELAYTFLDDTPIIAITGTAGKTTTVNLIAKMLEMNKLNVFLGGNIGTPFSQYIIEKQKADVIVLELSSFQLQGIHYFHPKVAGILNISPNHLDYHSSMDEYIEAKINITKRQTKDDFCLLPRSLSYLEEEYKIPSIVKYITPSQQFFSEYLIGEHNQENIEMAYQVSRIFGVSKQHAYEGIASFRSLPHRLEYVAVQKGITYINDSKSTTIDSLRVALQAIDGDIILLAGGKFKGGDIHVVNDEIKAKVKHIVLFGGSRDIFTQAWGGLVPLDYCSTLGEAVEYAKKIAVYGDTVLLSPATSSFDAFSSYIERGELFKRVVLGTIDIHHI